MVIQDLTINQNTAKFTWVELARDVLTVGIATILRYIKMGMRNQYYLMEEIISEYNGGWLRLADMSTMPPTIR